MMNHTMEGRSTTGRSMHGRRYVVLVSMVVLLLVLLSMICILRPQYFIPSLSHLVSQTKPCVPSRKQCECPPEVPQVNENIPKTPFATHPEHQGTSALSGIERNTGTHHGAYIMVLTMVITAPGNKDRRDAIRETWKNSYVEQGKQFDVKFVMGTLGVSDDLKESLLAENEKYNDLVLLTDHLDSYNNLTRKVLHMFMWADQNVNFSYLLKADDDTFVRLDVIESDLKTRTNPKPLYWGLIATTNTPHSKGKWKEDNWRLGDKYLPYAYGGGYILSAELIHRIATNADGLTLYNNEDVSVGVWVSSFDLEQKNDPQRFASLHTTRCANSNFLSVMNSLADLTAKHQRLKSGGTYCK